MSLSDRFSILQSVGLPVNCNGSRQSRSHSRPNISAVRHQKAVHRLNRGDQHRSRSKIQSKNVHDRLFSGQRSQSRGRQPMNNNRQGSGFVTSKPLSAQFGIHLNRATGDQRGSVGVIHGRIQKMAPIPKA